MRTVLVAPCVTGKLIQTRGQEGMKARRHLIGIFGHYSKAGAIYPPRSAIYPRLALFIPPFLLFVPLILFIPL
jgi:hypothetical protein